MPRTRQQSLRKNRHGCTRTARRRSTGGFRVAAERRKPITTAEEQRIFIGVYPAGIVFADRKHEVNGDYKDLAFLPYDTLILDIRNDCPAELVEEIKTTAAIYQARRGKQFRISSCGQTVTLGTA